MLAPGALCSRDCTVLIVSPPATHRPCLASPLGVRTREAVRQPHRWITMTPLWLVKPAPGVMRDTPLVHPHATREGTETPKRGQLSPRVRWWYLLALLLQVVASGGPGTSAAHGGSGCSPRTPWHGQRQGDTLHSSAGTRNLSLVFFEHAPLSVHHLYPVRFPREARVCERLVMQLTTPAGGTLWPTASAQD